MKTIDLTGKRFDRLFVLGRAGSSYKGEARWKCLCDCGNEIVTDSTNLRKGHTKSCGCLLADINKRIRTTHGNAPKKKKTTEYSIWCGIKKRCENPNCKAYPNYGGRGITMCERWKNDFAAFLHDVGRRPDPSLSIDRIDNNRGYEPGNTRWATVSEQARNRRNSRLFGRKEG